MMDNSLILKNAGLKVTHPRLRVLELLQNPKNHHISAEDLYKILLQAEDEVGLATIYRVLNQFEEVGIVNRHTFEGGKALFELCKKHHHDHLICLDCGNVFEFSDNTIEQRQRDISQQHNLNLSSHSLYLYGHCQNKANCKTVTKKDKIANNKN